MPNAPTPQLRECPSGHDAKHVHLHATDRNQFRVRCKRDCGWMGPARDTVEAAEAAWQRRHDPLREELRGKLDKMALDCDNQPGWISDGKRYAIRELQEWLEREGGGGK